MHPCVSGAGQKTLSSVRDGGCDEPGRRARCGHLRAHGRCLRAQLARARRHGDGRLPEARLQLGAVEHLGRRRADEAGAGDPPAGARSTNGPGSSSCRHPRARSIPRATARTEPRMSPRSQPAVRSPSAVRLPDQRHRPGAALRQDRGARPRRRQQPLGLPSRARGTGRGRPRRGGRADAKRRAPAVPGRRGPWHVHLRGRGIRVHRQPGVRAAQPRRARPCRDHMDHERVRARGLRDGRHAPEAGRLHHPEQHLQRFAFRRARNRLDHPRPRPEGRA